MPYHPAKQMSKNEMSAIMNALTDDSLVFEWGSGQSTIFFSQWCKQYYSVENVIGWFIKVERALVTDNVEYLYRPNADDYVNSMDSYKNVKFDILLIDGDWRVKCADAARKHIDKNTTVFVHDWDRIDCEYQPILDWYDVERVVDNLGILRIK